METQVEKWKRAPGYEEFYEVSNRGRIRSLSREKSNGTGYHVIEGKILRNTLSRGGYLRASFSVDGVITKRTVHRLVALAFIPNPNKLPFVNHKDGNKLNNNDWNLEWVTRLENSQHAAKMGLYRSGKTNPKSKPVCDLSTGVFYETAAQAAQALGISYSYMRSMLNGNDKNKTNLRYV